MTSGGELVRALDACIEVMRTDGIDAESAAARFPDVADELVGQLEMAAELQAMPAIPGPTAEFRSSLASQLASAPQPRSLRDSAPRPLVRWTKALWRSTAAAAAATAAVVVFLFGGAVYASADDLPGDALYSVKRIVEDARMLAAGEGELQLRLEFADRRLSEALLVPGSAGELLADFNYEITAALVETDYDLAAGEPVNEVVPPILIWLMAARVKLLEAQPELPTTAWRASLALLDEAISALRLQQTDSSAPVQRIADAGSVLRLRASDTLPWLRSDVARIDWPIAGGPGFGGTDGFGPGDQIEAPLAPLIEADGGIVAPPQPTPTTPVHVPPTERPVQPTAVPATPEPDDTDVPTKAPTATATSIALPTDAPTMEPTVDPTESIEPEPTDTPPSIIGSPTPEPPATDVPANRPPVIVECTCNPQTVKVYGESRCEVKAEDPDGDELSYEWSVDAGVIEHSDQPIAFYQAQIRIGGIAKVDIPIHVVVRDSRGGEVTQDVIIIVTPRVSKVGQAEPAPPGKVNGGPAGVSTAALEQSHAR